MHLFLSMIIAFLNSMSSNSPFRNDYSQVAKQEISMHAPNAQCWQRDYYTTISSSPRYFFRKMQL